MDDLAANSIARWNGESWSALGAGIEGYQDIICDCEYDRQIVEEIVVSGSDVYVAGAFLSAGGETADGFACRRVEPHRLKPRNHEKHDQQGSTQCDRKDVRPGIEFDDREDHGCWKQR